MRRISGMVTGPVVTTLVTGEPAIMPFTADTITAALAGPPRVWPNSASAARTM